MCCRASSSAWFVLCHQNPLQVFLNVTCSISNLAHLQNCNREFELEIIIKVQSCDMWFNFLCRVKKREMHGSPRGRKNIGDINRQ